MGLLTNSRLFFARLWQAAREVSVLLSPCRFSIFVVVAGAALLLLNAQGREIAVGLVDAPVLWAGVAFHFAVFLWAFQSWYWAHVMIMMVHGVDPERDAEGLSYPPHVAWFKREVPRLVAAAAYAVAGIALLLAGAWGHLIVVSIVAVLFYWLLVRRHAIVEKMRTPPDDPSEDQASQLQKFIGDPSTDISSLRDLSPLSKLILGLSAALAVLFTAWTLIDVVSIGWHFGAAAVAFLGFALIVPGGSVLIYWSRFGGHEGRPLGGKGYPVLTTLLLWALIVGAVVDNHQVRSLGPSPVDRASLETAALDWHQQAVKVSGSDEPPLILVATAGGGIRAAYWTATVLGRLQDEAPDFRTYLFAMSGVSGGSLGATVFTTLLADGTGSLNMDLCQGGNATDTGGGFERKAFECAGQEMLGRDFLGPTVAALLFPDLMQRFIPYPWAPDRAQALEQAWERAWPEIGFPEDTWRGRRFSQLWAGGTSKAHLPALFLNGTHVESGKRIVTSHVQIDGSSFPDTYDFYSLVSNDIRPSTAALNSARFTYVSPPGTLVRDQQAVGHIVDGGYFENFGAATAQELLTAVLAKLDAHGKKARPVLIQISNDPRLGNDELDVDRIEVPADREPDYWANETLSPLRALLNTRSARGVLAYKRFLARVDDKSRRAHFRLCSVEGYPDPALGWVLAPRSKILMQEQIRTDSCGNLSEFNKVLAAIQ